MVTIVVSSKNPVKIDAVKEAFKEYFKDVEIGSIEAGLFAQPFDKQIVEGAKARAREGLKMDPDYAVGLEGGIIKMYGVPYVTAFCSIIDRNGVEHGAWSHFLELPPEIVDKVKREGKELGHVMDELHGRTNIKQQEGAVGIMTKGRISRKDSLKEAVILALARFL